MIMIIIDEFGWKQQMEGQLGPGKQRCLFEKWNETSAKVLIIATGC